MDGCLTPLHPHQSLEDVWFLPTHIYYHNREDGSIFFCRFLQKYMETNVNAYIDEQKNNHKLWLFHDLLTWMNRLLDWFGINMD